MSQASEHLPEGSQVLGIPHRGVQASGPGHVNVEALAAAGSHLEIRTQERREESSVPGEESQDVSSARPVHVPSSLSGGETGPERTQANQNHTAGWDRGRVGHGRESMGLEEADPTRGYLLHSPAAREEVAVVMAM